MLASNLTLDDEEEVQEELRAIQEGIVDKTSIDLPSVPTTEPVKSSKGKTKLPFFSPSPLIISVVPESEPASNKVAIAM